MSMTKITGYLGIAAISLFFISLIVFGLLNQNFQFMSDFISKLGAKGEPYALWWNLTGFLLVGITLTIFGFAYGMIIKDKLVGILLSLFGLGFAFTAIPMDMINDRSPVSKAHIVAICLGLACWLFGLARMGYNPALASKVRRRANVAAILLVSAMAGFALQLWPMPLTHRLVFIVVFGWTLLASVELVMKKHLEV
ncbi:DUF998 domain-containing protein [Ekhidna sp.]|uniref:DUF998 domain-containing protein n=1 Tax=Ekhidna sp. TaxID=2608089 RepID=UPI003CCC3EF5